MTNNNRQKLILQYYPLVRQIASRVIKRLPSYIDLDDLIHIGTLGLIEAIDRFPTTNTPSFNTQHNAFFPVGCGCGIGGWHHWEF